MPLTELQVRSAKPQAKIAKLSDGGGLQLWVTPDGAKRWRLAYRFGGGQKLLAIGVYPAVGLKEARAVRANAKRLLASGVDPSEAKKQAKIEKANASENTFEAIADELVDKKRREQKAVVTVGKTKWLLSLAAAALGNRPIREIAAPEILAVLRKIESRGKLETAKRLRSTVGQVFRYAVATGRADSDPTGALSGAIAAPVTKHRAAIVAPKAFGALLRATTAYEGAPETVAALELLALTFVRPGELRSAEWSEFDLDGAVWSIPAPRRMKMRRPHLVPLCPRVIEVLRDLQTITGQGRFLFPSVRSVNRCMSENTINAALRRLGFGTDEMTAHGFRSAASSILNESGLWNPDAIERQLAHVDSDSVRRAYARADFWDERVRMMTWWAEKYDELRRGSVVVPLRARRGPAPHPQPRRTKPVEAKSTVERR
jgi:integrase